MAGLKVLAINSNTDDFRFLGDASKLRRSSSSKTRGDGTVPETKGTRASHRVKKNKKTEQYKYEVEKSTCLDPLHIHSSRWSCHNSSNQDRRMQSRR
jgi:hypothetical protein